MEGNKLIDYVVSFLVGGVTGLFYYAGLWWTVKSLPRSRRPVFLSLGSFYMRIGIALYVFYFVMHNDWRRLVVCLAGFMMVKIIITKKTGRAPASMSSKGASN
jgi:F1F0 ATPase subunit 2